jgi:hypothetical protein
MSAALNLMQEIDENIKDLLAQTEDLAERLMHENLSTINQMEIIGSILTQQTKTIAMIAGVTIGQYHALASISKDSDGE